MLATANLPKYLPIDENRKLLRDTSSMAIVNNDKEGLKQHRKRKQSIMKDKEALVHANIQIETLRTELNDLRSLVHQYIGINDGK
jgi:hypothetical protein